MTSTSRTTKATKATAMRRASLLMLPASPARQQLQARMDSFPTRAMKSRNSETRRRLRPTCQSYIGPFKQSITTDMLIATLGSRRMDTITHSISRRSMNGGS
eukprot:Rmarinus@m.10831